MSLFRSRKQRTRFSLRKKDGVPLKDVKNFPSIGYAPNNDFFRGKQRESRVVKKQPPNNSGGTSGRHVAG